MAGVNLVNREQVVATSAARTATYTSSTFTNNGHRGVLLVVNVTAGAATPSVVPAIQGYDPAGNVWFDLHADITAISSTSAATYTYLLYPGASETEGTGGITFASAGNLTRRWRVVMTAADADSLTYSIGAVLLV